MDKKRAVQLRRSGDVFKMRFDGVKSGHKLARIKHLDAKTLKARVEYPEGPFNSEYPWIRYPLHMIEEVEERIPLYSTSNDMPSRRTRVNGKKPRRTK